MMNPGFDRLRHIVVIIIIRGRLENKFDLHKIISRLLLFFSTLCAANDLTKMFGAYTVIHRDSSTIGLSAIAFTVEQLAYRYHYYRYGFFPILFVNKLSTRGVGETPSAACDSKFLNMVCHETKFPS